MASNGQAKLDAILAKYGLTEAQRTAIVAEAATKSNVPTSIADLAMGYVALALPRNAAGRGVNDGTRPSVFDELRETFPDLANASSASLAHVMATYTLENGRVARSGYSRVPESDPGRLAAVRAAMAWERRDEIAALEAELQKIAESESKADKPADKPAK